MPTPAIHAARAARFNALCDAKRAAVTPSPTAAVAGLQSPPQATRPTRSAVANPAGRSDVQSVPVRTTQHSPPLSEIDRDAAIAARILAARFGEHTAPTPAATRYSVLPDADEAAAQRVLAARFPKPQEGAPLASEMTSDKDSAAIQRILVARFGEGRAQTPEVSTERQHHRLHGSPVTRAEPYTRAGIL